MVQSLPQDIDDNMDDPSSLKSIQGINCALLFHSVLENQEIVKKY